MPLFGGICRDHNHGCVSCSEARQVMSGEKSDYRETDAMARIAKMMYTMALYK